MRLLSSKIASYNDNLVRQSHENIAENSITRWMDRTISRSIRQRLQDIIARLIGAFVFPVFAAVDLVKNLALFTKLRVFSLFSAKNDENRKKFAQTAQKIQKLIPKLARGILLSPASFISCDLVTRHYLEKPQAPPNTIASGGKYYSAQGIEVYPGSSDEVISFVDNAKALGKKIAIAGAHYSQSKNTLPIEADAYCLNMQKINHVEIDPNTKRARVGAGASWKDVQDAANAHGLAVKVMQASNVFSVGGSLSVNCHGWDHQAGTLAECVTSIKIVDARGKLQTLTPQEPLFSLVVGGHGLFGVIVEVELSLCDNEALVSWGKKITPDTYAEYFQKEILPNSDHRMHLYRLSLDPDNLLREGVAITYSAKTAKFPMQAQGVSKLKDEPEEGTRSDRILMHMGRSIPLARKLYWAKESRRIVGDEKQLRNEIMRPPIYAGFSNSKADAEWLQEFFIKPSEFAPFLAFLSQVLTENEVALLNASVRFVKKDDKALMGYAKDEDRFAVVLFFKQMLTSNDIDKTQKWVQKVISYLNDHGGSYYLPYQHFATSEQFQKAYPQAAGFARMKRVYDPDALFQNGFYEDYISKINNAGFG